jgi:putative ABC transport system permease protein
MDMILQHLKYGFRSLRATPRLTFAALACIGLGLGSAVFMFTLINAVLLRSAPFPHPDRLVRLWTVADQNGAPDDISYLDFQDVKQASKSFTALEMTTRTRFAVMTDDGTERMRGEAVTPGYFQLIAQKTLMGRLFSAEEYARGANRVVLISYDMWQRKFSGRPNVVGETVRARGTLGANQLSLYTIVGVMPAGFIGTVDADVSDFWIPAESYEPRSEYENRRERGTWAIGLLKPDVSLPAAQAEIQQIGRRLAAVFPKDYEHIHLGLEPFGESWRVKYRAGLLMLLGAAVLLLLIACTNVANLLLARLAQRENELMLRLVLGAQRKRVLGQLLTESLLLSLTGGAVGALLAFAGIRLFALANVIKLPPYVALTPDARVIALTAVLMLLTGVVFGVLPAWFGSRVNASQNLREAGRSVSLGRRQRLYGQFLVVLEVSFTFVLLIGSVLMLRSYMNLTHSDLGFRTQNLLRMAVSLDQVQYATPQSQINFIQEARTRLANYPGVSSMTFVVGVLPPWFDAHSDLAVNGEPNDALKHIDRHAVDADFFSTLGIPLLEGRGIRASDRVDAPRVAVVSRSLARFIATGDGSGAVGKVIQTVTNATTAALSPPIEIVGVVQDVHYHGPLTQRQYDYDLYLPIEQRLGSVISFGFHTSVDPATLIQPLRRELGRIVPTSPVHWVSTMKDELALQAGDNRFYAYLTGVYATCAVLLAILGIYSVLANSVSRRFGEIGIRMAMGAQSGDIVQMVLVQGMKTLVFGLVVGVALALFGTKLVASLLHGVGANDPLSFAAVTLGLLVLGVLACYLPARRATRADPLIVLRGE